MPEGVSLRPVEERDCRLLWELRNDPETRAASFHTGPIPLESHERWFRQALGSPEMRIFVVQEPSGRCIGYVRFHLRGDQAEVSVSIEPGSRGKGYGTSSLRWACDRLLSGNGTRQVIAYVKISNPASARAFRHAGFSELGRGTVQGTEVIQMAYPTSPEWVFRVDAGAGIGLGHLRRSLSLAEALRRKGQPSLFVTRADPVALGLLGKAGYPAEPLPQLEPWSQEELRWSLELAGARGPVGVVIDSEEPGAEYLAGWKQAGFFTAIRDDLGLRSLPVDLVINGNADAQGLPYPPDPSTQYLLGPSYAALAPEFWDRTARRIVAKSASRLLILCGGEDAAGSLPILLQRLDDSGLNLEVTAVIGPFFRDRARLDPLIAGPRGPVRLVESPSVLYPLMLQADLAISAAGQTLYDLACAGCPALAYPVAENQVGQLQAMERAGCVVRIEASGLDLREKLERVIADHRMREGMARRGQALVDGQGAQRVASVLVQEGKAAWNRRR